MELFQQASAPSLDGTPSYDLSRSGGFARAVTAIEFFAGIDSKLVAPVEELFGASAVRVWFFEEADASLPLSDGAAVS